jgi:glycosyltransferase involved in cell wall biosynthesis
MRVLYLSNRVPWFGAHTGYERLPDYLETAGLESKIYSPGSDFLSRALGKIHSLRKGHGRISQSDAAARWRLERGLNRERGAVGHLLYGEEHLPYWRDASPEARRRSVLTLHQPSSQWTEEKVRGLPDCPRVLVLWQKEMDWFRERLKGGEVDFVPHGADTDFFSPALEISRNDGPKRLLYVGVHLRNPAMLARIVSRLSRERVELEFDLLVPPHRRAEPELAKLAEHPRVHWHGNVDDEQLRELYRAAHLLLLPMNNSGANTAVVEALACGLPVLTTDVGGIRDYGGGTVYPVVENDDDEGMLRLIERYVMQPSWRDEVSRHCRAFAQEQLSWPRIAQQHAEIYRKVAG